MKTYTAFCQDRDSGGSTWISIVEATDTESAIIEARTRCADDWGYDDPEDIHVLGIAKGDITILHWDDEGGSFTAS